MTYKWWSDLLSCKLHKQQKQLRSDLSEGCWPCWPEQTPFTRSRNWRHKFDASFLCCRTTSNVIDCLWAQRQSKAVNDVRSCASTRKLVPKCGVEVSPMALISGACHQPNSAACWQWTGLITSHVTCQHRSSVFNRRRLPRTSESSCLLFLPVIIHLCLLCNNYCIQHTTELVTGPKFTNKIDLVKKYSAKQVDTCSKMWNTDIQ